MILQELFWTSSICQVELSLQAHLLTFLKRSCNIRKLKSYICKNYKTKKRYPNSFPRPDSSSAQLLLPFLSSSQSIKVLLELLPAPSRNCHFLRSHVSSDSPIIFANQARNCTALNWLKLSDSSIASSG